MALQKSITTQWGIELPEAYIRVANLNLNYDSSMANILVATHKDKQARLDKMQPITVKEYRINNEGNKSSVQASYTIQLEDAMEEVIDETTGEVTGQIDVDNVFSIDLVGDGVNVFTLTEGVDFEAGVDFNETIDNLVTALKGIVEINDNWIPYNIGENKISFIARKDKAYDGVLGNNVVVGHNMVIDLVLDIAGTDKVEGNFTKYYHVYNLDELNKNVINNSYEYLKTLPEFEDSINV